MVKVTLREKKLKKGRSSLYLDFYPPIIVDGKQTRREHLRLYIYDKPKSELEREHNKETKILGANLCAQRQLDLQAGSYGFVSARAKRGDFIEYFAEYIAEKKIASSTIKIWNAVYRQLKEFTGGKLPMSNVTESFCKRFKQHLVNTYRPNTAYLYFTDFKAVVADITEKRLSGLQSVKVLSNPNKEEVLPEHLSLEELKRLVKTPCKCPVLKQAALFSALTGLRFSDIYKLDWSEVFYSKEQGGDFIKFRQKKTDNAELLPISSEARELCGQRGKGQVFKGLAQWQCSHYLLRWILKAKINRHITFHSFRHTFAVLQLSGGTGIYTISKMLGHKNLSTTQIYARVLDAAKREAANKITLK